MLDYTKKILYIGLNGFAGAGNHVFYIDEDHNLIYLNGSEKTVLSDNIIESRLASI